MTGIADSFVHLRAHSAYSLLEGAIKIPKLVKLAKEAEMPALALTDKDNLFGSLEFSGECAKNGVQPIIGIQLSLVPFFQESMSQGTIRASTDQLLLLAKDETGYANLMRIASKSYLASESNDSPLIAYTTLIEHNEGLIALSGGLQGAIGGALCTGNMARAEEALKMISGIFSGRFYLEITRHGLPMERTIEPQLLELAYNHNIPLVATNDIYFAGGIPEYEAHDALLCIAGGRYVGEENRRRLTPEHRFKTAKEMRLLFADLPEAIDNTLLIAQRCAVMSPKRKPILPSFVVAEDGRQLTEAEALREKAWQGLENRLETMVFTPGMTEEERQIKAKPYYERLDFELNVIIQMQYPGYFLIVSDFIIWAKTHNIPVGPGRGSGAASVVAWSLQITDLDPLLYDLVFERFLNPERVSMPDFDIDFCQDRRDEVIRYVQERYGRDRVAQIITFGKLQARAVLRDVGRVLQLPYPVVDRICKLVPNNPAAPVTLQQAIDMEPMLRHAMEHEEGVDKMVEISLQLEGLYRHASTHAAGVVIADRPLDELVALYRDPRSDMPVIQYSMKYAEDAGLVKFDFLGLKTLTVLQTALELIKKRGIEIDLLALPLDDKPTYQLLTRGDTVGIFQFESAGMRDSLRKLKPDCLEDLVALGALYRPGPMDNNIPTYINRKHGREKLDCLHPMLEPVLKETYGVIIYQEQVQKIAQVMAGYTLGGADLLRRAMGKKIKEEMDAQRAKFVEGAQANNVDKSQASFIFDLVAKFAGYGFNKAHAAAYALIGYQTAYLKANYPVEFIAASMTLDMHNTDKLAIFREDAVRLGIDILPPDINKSEASFGVESVEEKLVIRYALGALKGVGLQAMHQLVEERKSNGPLKDIFDVFQRVDSRVLNKRQLESMVRAGVFDSVNPNRKAVYESIEVLMAYSHNLAEERATNQINLFGDATENQTLPALSKSPDWPPLERLEQEFSAVGFYLSAHPLEGYLMTLKKMNVTPSSHLAEKFGKDYTKVNLAGIVTAVKYKVSDKGRFAFVQLSDPSGVYEVSVFNEQLLNNSRELLEAGTLVLIHAEGKRDDSGPRVIAQDIKPLQEMTKNILSKSLDIYLDSPEPVARIRELIGIPMHRGTSIVFHVPVGESRAAKIKLAEPYEVPPETVLLMRTLIGISDIIEA